MMSLREACRIILLSLLVGVGAAPAPGAGPPDAKRDGKRKPAPVQERLAALLQKALLDNEREHGKSLEALLKLFKAAREGGAFSLDHVREVERELLESRVRALHREAAYRDAVDRLGLRFDAGEKRLGKVEQEALLPLARHLRRLQDDFTAFQAVLDGLARPAAPEKAAKLRAKLRGIAASAAIVEGTTFRTELPRRWATWEKLSPKELAERLRKDAEERRKLLDARAAAEAEGGAPKKAEERRLRELAAEMELGQFEEALKLYEAEPWRKLARAELRERQQGAMLRTVLAHFIAVLGEASDQRLEAWRKTWPNLPPVVVEKLDLLACDREKAERAVAARFDRPEAAVAGKSKLRKVRALAEAYRLQQQLFELAHFQVQGPKDGLASPFPRGPVGEAGSSALARRLLDAQRSLARARGQLLSTWVEHQMARLELYRDLRLAPP